MAGFEMIDIVDSNDNVIKTIERTKEWNAVRAESHRIVQVLVFNSKGELLLQQRSAKKSFMPLQFDASVGGLVSAGQTYEENAKKEMFEELGIKAELELVKKIKLDRTEENPNFEPAFMTIYKAVSDGPYTNWEDEAERIEFFTLDELEYLTKRMPYMFTNGIKKSIKLYLESYK